MIKDYRRKPDWFERHAGLGGWLGSIGTVLAIFAAWWLAHGEYLRTVRAENDRTNSEIAMISRTANEFDKFVQQYIQAAESGDLSDGFFYNTHMNDAEFHRTYDLNNMPITQWPSVESYDAYKRYTFAATKLMEISTQTQKSKEDFEDKLKSYQGTLERVQSALDAAKRRDS
jgi:hypothetical protein